MKPSLNLTQAISSKNVESITDLLCLGTNTNDYIDSMSPVEWAILKKKIKMAEMLLDNVAECISIE